MNRLAALGAQTLHGSLDDLQVLANGARAADGVIHMAFGGDFSDPASMSQRDCAAIDAKGKALIGSDKLLVITSGTLVMLAGMVATEQDAPDPHSLGTLRIPGEQACLEFAGKGVRCIVMRLAPTVHGTGDHGFIPFLICTARRTGVSVYVADGANRWPTVHRQECSYPLSACHRKSTSRQCFARCRRERYYLQTIAHRIDRSRYRSLPQLCDFRKIVESEQYARRAKTPYRAAIANRD